MVVGTVHPDAQVQEPGAWSAGVKLRAYSGGRQGTGTRRRCKGPPRAAGNGLSAMSSMSPYFQVVRYPYRREQATCLVPTDSQWRAGGGKTGEREAARAAPIDSAKARPSTSSNWKRRRSRERQQINGLHQRTVIPSICLWHDLGCLIVSITDWKERSTGTVSTEVHISISSGKHG